jgi:hypothetical protein
MSSSTSKHTSQTTDGDLAARHASVLLAKTPTELEAAYDRWASQYDDDLVAISGLPPGQWELSAVKQRHFKDVPTYFGISQSVGFWVWHRPCRKLQRVAIPTQN